MKRFIQAAWFVLTLTASPVLVAGNWFADFGAAYNLDSPDNGQDFEGGREIAILGLGYEFDSFEVGYGHLSHLFRGGPGDKWFGWSSDEEQIDMLYIKKRVRW